MRNGTYNYDLAQHKYETRLKQRSGDLEIDTVIGSNHKGALVTINDRFTSKVWTRKLSGEYAAKHQEIVKEFHFFFLYLARTVLGNVEPMKNLNSLVYTFGPTVRSELIINN